MLDLLFPGRSQPSSVELSSTWLSLGVRTVKRQLPPHQAGNDSRPVALPPPTRLLTQIDTLGPASAETIAHSLNPGCTSDKNM